MKAYVIELDNKLRVVGEQHEHLGKKYAIVRDKQQHLVVENKKIISKHQSTVGAYKGKLQGYEKLINKLTEELERHIHEHPGGTSSPDIKSVITVYEGKLLSMGNELSAWKHETSEMQKKLSTLEPQLRSKLDLICDL
jgi:chromosome segregation ATPase